MQVSVQDLDYYSSLRIVGWDVRVFEIYSQKYLRFWLDPKYKFQIEGVKKPLPVKSLQAGQTIISGNNKYRIVVIYPPVTSDIKIQDPKQQRPKTYFATDFLLKDFCNQVCTNNVFNYEQTKKSMKSYHILTVSAVYTGLLLTTIFGDVLYKSGATFDDTTEVPFLVQPTSELNTIKDNMFVIQAV